MKYSQQTAKDLRIVVWAFLWLVFIMGMSEYLLSNGWPWKISWIEPYMLRKNNDDWTHNAFEIQKIKNRTASHIKGDTLVFVGGSISLEAISSDPEMSRRLKELTGEQTNFRSICATYQTFADDAKISRELGAFGGILLIGIEPLSFKAKLTSQITEKLKTGHTHLKYYYLSPGRDINGILLKYGFEGGLFHRFRLFKTAKVFGEIMKKKVPVLLTSGYKAVNTCERL